MYNPKVSIELAYSEIALLDKILESYRADLREEIRKTDDFNFRENLKEEEASIQKLLQRLEATNFIVVM